MLSQQDMEDFMEIEAALVEEDEDAAKPGKPSNATLVPKSRCEQISPFPAVVSGSGGRPACRGQS